MKALIAIDPGVHNCGVAVFDQASGECLSAYLFATGTLLSSPYDGAERVLLERQVVYPGMPKVDLNDLLDLAMVTGKLEWVFNHYSSVSLVKPFDWKGNMPKEKMTARIKSKLTEKERQQVRLPPQKSLHHNVYDAIGIGLWHFKRLNRSPNLGE